MSTDTITINRRAFLLIILCNLVSLGGHIVNLIAA